MAAAAAVSRPRVAAASAGGASSAAPAVSESAHESSMSRDDLLAQVRVFFGAFRVVFSWCARAVCLVLYHLFGVCRNAWRNIIFLVKSALFCPGLYGLVRDRLGVREKRFRGS